MIKISGEPIAIDPNKFGRTNDVKQRYGIKRGTLYNLHKQKRVDSILLFVMGDKSGTRYWSYPSIDKLFKETMREQKPEQEKEESLSE
jgi:hypothetical protein